MVIDVYDLLFLKAVTVAWICAESQTFKFFGFFFKQRNILNKSYFNTEIVENCLIAKEKNHLSFLFCGQYRKWKCLVILTAVKPERQQSAVATPT